MHLTLTQTGASWLCMYMQREEILFKSKPSEKQTSFSKISCDRKVEVDLSIFFFFTFFCGRSDWKTTGDFICNSWVTHWASCFIRVQVGGWKLCLRTKGGVIFKWLFTFKDQNIRYISSLPTKINVAGHFFNRKSFSNWKLCIGNNIKF